MSEGYDRITFVCHECGSTWWTWGDAIPQFGESGEFVGSDVSVYAEDSDVCHVCPPEQSDVDIEMVYYG